MKRNVNVLYLIFFIAILLACNSKQATTAQTGVKKQLVPGEPAPLADPGQKNFGGMRPAVGTQGQNEQPRPQRPEPKIQTVSLEDISMSDPYIYPDEKNHTYYLTGTGGRLYKSKDLL